MKKNYIDFMGKRKVFWLISLSLIAIGILCNIIFGVQLDIKFTGGSMFKYSYSDGTVSAADVTVSAADAAVEDAAVSAADAAVSYLANGYFTAPSVAPVIVKLGGDGEAAVSAADVSAADVAAEIVSEADAALDADIVKLLAGVEPDMAKDIDPDEIEKVVGAVLGEKVTANINTRININEGDVDNKTLVISLAEKKALDQDASNLIIEAVKAKYPNIELTLKESNSVDPTMGREFFWKCMIAVILASLFMVLYVAFRFKKVGGWTAGASGIIAILHDCLIVYFTFVIFRYPLDDNFIAVILAIIGYSLNSTIVIFDRIRENRRLLGPKTPAAQLANISMNETLGRTINTNLCVFAAVAIVAIVSVIFGLSSVMSFAVPMMFGTISGCYSSLVISNSIWVTWQEAIEKKQAAKKAEQQAARKNNKKK